MDNLPAHDQLSIDPGAVADVGAKLASRATDFSTRAANIAVEFESVSHDQEPAPQKPYAADPRNEPAQPVVDRHERAMAAAGELLRDLGAGLNVFGQATAGPGRELSDADTKLAAELQPGSEIAG